MVAVLIVFLVVVLCAWVALISLFLGVKKEKGYPADNDTLLWFIGIFATPLAVGLYVVALPDKSASRNHRTVCGSEKDLPAV